MRGCGAQPDAVEFAGIWVPRPQPGVPSTATRRLLRCRADAPRLAVPRDVAVAGAPERVLCVSLMAVAESV